jgi:hypothetical protein
MIEKKAITLREARSIATRTTEQLSGLSGDPLKAADWIRERQLAEIVITLLDRIERGDLTAPIMVGPTRELQRERHDRVHKEKP